MKKSFLLLALVFFLLCFESQARELDKAPETDPLLSQVVKQLLRCDINNDDLCNDEDKRMFEKGLGQCTGEINYSWWADEDRDGCITEKDRAQFVQSFEEKQLNHEAMASTYRVGKDCDLNEDRVCTTEDKDIFEEKYKAILGKCEESMETYPLDFNGDHCITEQDRVEYYWSYDFWSKKDAEESKK